MPRPRREITAPETSSLTTPSSQSALLLTTASETNTVPAVAPDALISTQSVPGVPRYIIDRARCAWINNGSSREFETCINGYLNYDGRDGLDVNVGNLAAFVPFNQVQAFCKTYRNDCVKAAQANFKRVYDATRLNSRCLYDAGRELKMTDARMKSVKFGVVLGGNALIAAGGFYTGFKIVDWPTWLRAANASASSALGVVFNEWAFAWLYTASFQDAGSSVVGAMLVASYKVAANLPEYFRTFDYGGVVRAVQATCPPNAHFAADELP